MKNSNSNIIVIVGPTASGKSSLAVLLARKFGGEVISADSRQVYRGLDIGTGKITKKEMGSVPHHMIDVISPKGQFSVSDYKEQAERIIKEILLKKKIPIVCGGTGFYIQALADGMVLPNAPPNTKLRTQLEKKSTQELVKILARLDKRRTKNIDIHNKRRLIRAIEIAHALGKVPVVKAQPIYTPLFIGLDRNNLRKSIGTRLEARMRKGMIAEVKKLHGEGLSWKRMEELGLEYRYSARYLQNKITKEEFLQQLEIAIWHYAQRQRRWFKRDNRIRWFISAKDKKIEQLLRKFLR